MDNASDSLPQSEPNTETAESDPDQRLDLDSVIQAGDWSALGRVDSILARVSRTVCKHAGMPAAHCEVAVALSDDAAVRRLNLQYRGKDKSTNVLSFPAPMPVGSGEGPLFLGDVVLAAETLADEANTASLPLADHFTHLVVHGILHLLGFDHVRDRDAELMERTEIAVLADLGICDPYANQQLEEAVDQPG